MKIDMVVLVAIQAAVHRHRIVGVYTDYGLCKAAAEAAIKAEPDHHHIVEVVKLRVDELFAKEIHGLGNFHENVIGAFAWDEKSQSVIESNLRSLT